MVESTVESMSKAVVDLTQKTQIRVLHVDDEAGFLKTAKQILEIQGNFQVETASSVKEALERMKEKTFDVIVSDYIMPEKSGLDFLKDLRQKGNMIPFIIFTGKGREEVAIEALNLGADHYINKIGKPETVYGELAHGIRQVIKVRQAEEKLRNMEKLLRERKGEMRTQALSYLIGNLFEMKSLDDCLDVAIKGLSMLGLFQSQISLLEDGYFVVKRNRMDKKYQFLLEKIGGVKFSGHKIDVTTSFNTHLLESKIVTTTNIKDSVKIRLEDFIKEYLPKEWGKGRRFGIVKRVVSAIPKRIDLLILPLNIRGDVIGAVGISTPSIETGDVRFMKNLCELFAQAFQRVQREAERKKTEERIKKTSEEWAKTFDAISDYVFIVDKDFRLMKVNKAFSNILNKKPEELIGKRCFEVLHGTNKPWLNCPHKKTLKTKKPTTEEVFDPNIGIPLLITNSPILDENGEITGCVHIAKDISERKKIEETLRLQRDVATTLMGTSSLEESVNRLFDKFLELKEFDCAGFYLVDKDTGELHMILHRGLPEGFVEKVSHFDADSPYARVVMGGEPVYQKTSDFPPIIREDLESDGILAVAAIPIHYKGEVIADLNLASHSHDEIPVLTRNVLESTCAQIGEAVVRARMEERLRMNAETLQESEQKYRRIVELAPDGIATMNMKGVVTSVNPAFLRLTGFSKDEIVGKHFTKIGTLRARDLPRYIKLFGSIIRGKIPPPMEFAYLRKDGTQCWGEAHSSLLKEGDKTVGFQAILRDTTGRKRTLEKVKMLNEKLSVVGKVTRHDIRNKLQAVISNAYLAKQTPTDDNETMKYLGEVESACEQAERILDFANTYEKLGVEELAYLDVEKSLKESGMLFADLHGAKIVNDCHGLTVLADSLLQQLFYNLIDNSVKHGERVTQIRAYYEKAGKDKLKLIYQDNGVGIHKFEKKKIFREGYGKGTGYGLYLIRKLCEVYSWGIRETGKHGKGAQFTITIPKINESGKIAYRLH